MSILVDRNTRLLVQGITGDAGRFHTLACREYGTNVVAGVTPGRGGTRVSKIPVFDTVADAVEKTGANTSMIFVPAAFAADAVLEAVDAGIAVVVCITEGLPALDEVRVKREVARAGARLIGPNGPGILSPGEKAKVGIMPGYIHRPGGVGVVSRSGTLTYEAVWQLSSLGLGQSTCLGIGGDPVPGTSFVDVLALFEADPETDAILMIGEIGGTAEEDAAAFVKAHVTKPVGAFVAGRTAPSGKRMGHAGAIIAGGKGTAAEKQAALVAAGIRVAESPADMGRVMAALLERRGRGRGAKRSPAKRDRASARSAGAKRRAAAKRGPAKRGAKKARAKSRPARSKTRARKAK